MFKKKRYIIMMIIAFLLIGVTIFIVYFQNNSVEALSKYGKPEIFNTDQGSQYTSCIHTQTLEDNGITISMDGKGRATDNICIERFWRSAKVEKIYLNEYFKISTLKNDVSDYMEFYNYRRFHETLNYKKPMNVYYDNLKINDEKYTKLDENVA